MNNETSSLALAVLLLVFLEPEVTVFGQQSGAGELYLKDDWTKIWIFDLVSS